MTLWEAAGSECHGMVTGPAVGTLAYSFFFFFKYDFLNFLKYLDRNQDTPGLNN